MNNGNLLLEREQRVLAAVEIDPERDVVTHEPEHYIPWVLDVLTHMLRPPNSTDAVKHWHPSITVCGTARVGAHVLLGKCVTVSHGAVLGDRVSVGKNTVIGRDVIISPYVRVGRCCVVGDKSVITADVPDHTVVPALTLV